MLGAAMCIFLCANPEVHALLDGMLLRAYRASLQLWTVCPLDPCSADRSRATEKGVEAEAEKIVRGRLPSDSVWWTHELRDRRRPVASAHEWKHPLDALTNAWSRLLTLVGWRR
jgi:hypothetical protein